MDRQAVKFTKWRRNWKNVKQNGRLRNDRLTDNRYGRLRDWGGERLRNWLTDQSERMREWQNDRVIEWQSDRVTEWQSDKVKEWQSDSVTEWSNDRYADWETYKAGRLKNCMKVLLKFLFLIYEIRSFIFAEEKHILLNFSTRVLRLTGKR